MSTGTRLVLLLVAGLWLPIGLRTGLEAAAASHIPLSSAAGISAAAVSVLSYGAFWLACLLVSFLSMKRAALLLGVGLIMAPFYGAARWVNVYLLPGRHDPGTLLGNLGILLVLLVTAAVLTLLIAGGGAGLDRMLPRARKDTGRAGPLPGTAALYLAVWGAVFFLSPSLGGTKTGETVATGEDLARIAPREDPARRVCLVGIDGATWDLILPLVAEGELPTFRRLMNQGHFGSLATLQSSSASPALWTSIATGADPRAHGIDFFVDTLYRPPLSRAWLAVPASWRAPVVAGGLNALAALKIAGRRKVPVNGSMRRVPALWEILTTAGRRSLVVNWWASWPADPVNGVLVSDMADLLFAKHFGIAEEGQGYEYLETIPRVVHPPERLEEVMEQLRVVSERQDAWKRWLPSASDAAPRPSLRLDPDDPLSYFRLGFLSDEATLRNAEHFLSAPQGDPFDFIAIYFRGLDWVEHYLWDSLEPEFFPDDLPGVKAAALRDAVPDYYRFIDDLLARVTAALDESTVLLVVSDHGHRRAVPYGVDGDHRGTHDSWPRPDGIFLAYGPGLRENDRVAVTDAGLLDIAPTVLTILGVPCSETMDGEPLAEILDPRALQRKPAVRVGAYARLAPQGTQAGPSEEVDAEAVERLRSLGYL